MFINFARKLFELLVSDEFTYIKKVDNRLVYDTSAFSLYKDKGSVLYIVSIINAEIILPGEYEALTDEYSGLSDGETRARIILLNVLVNDRESKFVYDEDYSPEKKVYIFSYSVNLDDNTLNTPDEQPELLGLDVKINEALENTDETYVNGTHLTSLESDIVEKNALPIKSENISLTIFLISINIVLWVLMELSGGSENTWTLAAFGAVSSNLVLNLHQYYRVFTAIFLHIGIAHLANNSLALYVFGSRTEKYFGKLQLLIIYLLSGIAGNIVTVFFIPSMSAGASGGVFGLLGALLSLTYRTGRSVSDLSPYVILLLCISSIGMGFLNPFTNNFAHVAGFITGALLGRALYRRF